MLLSGHFIQFLCETENERREENTSKEILSDVYYVEKVHDFWRVNGLPPLPLTPTLWIDPFNEKQVNPNSYDLTLASELRVYDTRRTMDTRTEQATTQIHIPPEGIVLHPGTLYLGRTREFTKTVGLVPMLEGKSSLARLGLGIHITGGWGDQNFEGRWILEMTVVHLLRVYAGDPICQIAYSSVSPGGPVYNGRYQGQTEVTPSRLPKSQPQEGTA